MLQKVRILFIYFRKVKSIWENFTPEVSSQPTEKIYFITQEASLKKKLTTKKKKKKPLKATESKKDEESVNEPELEQEEEDGNGNEEPAGNRERASTALITPKKGKLKGKAKVKEETLEAPESPDNEEKPLKGKMVQILQYTILV